MKAVPLPPALLVVMSQLKHLESLKNESLNFLFQLLKRNASLRLGAGPGDAAEVQVKASVESRVSVGIQCTDIDFRS